MKKPGRPKKNLNINIDTKKVDVNVTRKDGKLDIKIDKAKILESSFFVLSVLLHPSVSKNILMKY